MSDVSQPVPPPVPDWTSSLPPSVPEPLSASRPTVASSFPEAPPYPPVAAPPVATRPATKSSGPGWWRGAIEWVVIIAVALIGAMLMRTFLVQAFFIPSESMVPTLEKGDRVLVNKLSYHLHAVHRGDIVVFTRPPGVDRQYKDLIKRVIGLPGDVVSGRDGHVYIDGRLLNEPYLPEGTVTQNMPTEKIPAGTYWVMGDNRTNSADSRVFGPIAKQTIVGRAFVIWWPLSRIGLL